MKVIKPNSEKKKDNNLLMPIIYLIVGVILAFKSNEAIQLLFYIIGILVIVYGIKLLVDYFKNKDVLQNNKINLSVAIVSIIIGVLLIILSEALEVSIRYVLGFFLVYMGVSRLLTQVGFGTAKLVPTLSSIILIILGVYSIFVSNAILIVIGWILIINSLILFWECFKR